MHCKNVHVSVWLLFWLSVPGLMFSSQSHGALLVSGGTVSGSISVDGEVDTHTFDGQAGDRVWVLMAATDSSTSLTPEITIAGPGGFFGDDNDFPAIVSGTLPVGGIYTVFAQDWAANGSDTGNYTIHFVVVPGAVGDGELVSGTSIRGTIDQGGDLDSFSFHGTAGMAVWISADAVNSDVDPAIFLYDPDGSLVRRDEGPGLSEIDVVSLPADGKYTVVLYEWDANGFDSGDYVLSFATAPGLTEFGVLTNGDSVDDSLTPGDIDSFQFYATAGDTISISTSRLDDSSITREFHVYTPEGDQVLRTNDASVIRTLQSTGFHTILLREWSANGVDSGDYRLTFTTTGSPPPVFCNGLPVTVNLNLGQTPGPDHDVILGTPGDDDIRGRAGNDTICGMGGNDFIHGNSGDDWIDGGDGVDNIRGGQGADTIFAGSGATVGTSSRVFGGTGDDTIFGGPDADDLRGGRGEDMISGEQGADEITGNEDDDTLYGGPGPDSLKGGGGNDELFGEGGGDSLNGGSGNRDFCEGGLGGDTDINCELF